MRSVPKSSAMLTISNGHSTPKAKPASITPKCKGASPGKHKNPWASAMRSVRATKHQGRAHRRETTMSESMPPKRRPRLCAHENVATAVAAEASGPLRDAVMAPKFVVSKVPPPIKAKTVNHSSQVSGRLSICAGPPAHGDTRFSASNAAFTGPTVAVFLGEERLHFGNKSNAGKARMIKMAELKLIPLSSMKEHACVVATSSSVIAMRVFKCHCGVMQESPRPAEAAMSSD
mmetsp:Transcript_99098/g.266181  ORF Transcript_99098/g.266181 Transcript_99098/m.266181 type:complete len:232 (+) Transcript_99098:403-1098(+)